MFKKVKELPKGTRDIIGRECQSIDYVIKSFNSYFDGLGYEEVITPSFEFNDAFNNINQEQMYKFYDSDGKLLNLKTDSTLAIARLVSSKLKDKECPLRLRYTSKIFRVHKELSGKRNEMFDAGIELIGDDKVNSDIEAIVFAIEYLKSIGIDDFKIEVGHIGVIQKIISILNLNDEEKEIFIELVDGKKLIDLNIFVDKLSITDNMKKSLLELPWLFGDIEKISVSNLVKDAGLEKFIDYLNKISSEINKLGLANYLSFDLGAATKVEYYSGIVFSAYVEGASSDILQGGRYDNIMNSYGRNLGAVGFSIRVDEIANLIYDKIDFKKEPDIISYNTENHIEILAKVLNKTRNGERVILTKEKNI